MITLSYPACQAGFALWWPPKSNTLTFFLSLLTQNGQDKLNQPNFGNCFLWYQINILSLLCLVFAFFEQLFHWTCTFVSNLESEEICFGFQNTKEDSSFTLQISKTKTSLQNNVTWPIDVMKDHCGRWYEWLQAQWRWQRRLNWWGWLSLWCPPQLVVSTLSPFKEELLKTKVSPNLSNKGSFRARCSKRSNVGLMSAPWPLIGVCLSICLCVCLFHSEGLIFKAICKIFLSSFRASARKCFS